MSERKLGVYICHCGGNISDCVDVERVRSAAAAEPGVAVAKTALFACSDATQQEMVQDIREQGLGGLVVASCSPKLHLFTFRETAKRAGLNPYQYTQVNIREQCSWTHRDDPAGATEKAVRLVRGGIAKTKLTQPLEPIVVETVPGVLVIGAGIAGLRAAVGLADLGLSVLLVEKAPEPGGRVAGMGKMYPQGKTGRELINELVEEVRKRERINLFTNAELEAKAGSIGDFQVKIRVGGGDADRTGGEVVTARVGSIIVATGFDPYRPAPGEYGYGMTGVVTLPEFRELLDGAGDGPLFYRGKAIQVIVYIYCVGSRQEPGQKPDGEKVNRYCSRYCCSAAVHAALLTREKNPSVRQFHLCRDVRTYGKFELLYDQAMKGGSVFLKFPGDEPPVVEQQGNGRLKVTVRDLLTWGERLALEADLVVLVTGMVPRENGRLVDLLKIPLGRDGFFNEIHPKLRPVETVVGGVFICGAAQGPKNSTESVASALAAVTQSAALLKKGYVELEPLIASVNPELCTWCAQCAKACPYAAIEQAQGEEKEVARVNRALCKGCGGCVPACPAGALDLQGYTDAQIRAMIDAFLKEAS
ncbi:MAG: CoB--CoM heterodisulfide reductase iron-sulfur subunit A family protein [Bacillota bacterium]